jgi:nicotinamide mononucleotide transporter
MAGSPEASGLRSGKRITQYVVGNTYCVSLSGSMAHWLDISYTLFTVFGYPLSLIELVATVSGLTGVYAATRAHISTWPIGMVNVSLMFWMFYQVQLYADMFLQVFFLTTSVYGWWNWNRKRAAKPVGYLSNRWRVGYALLVLLGSALSGWLFSHIHLWLPDYFPEESSFPFVDSFILVGSMAGTFLLARQKVENWMLWVLIDCVAVALYAYKGIVFIALQYSVFTLLATYGWWNWCRKYHRPGA